MIAEYHIDQTAYEVALVLIIKFKPQGTSWRQPCNTNKLFIK